MWCFLCTCLRVYHALIKQQDGVQSLCEFVYWWYSCKSESWAHRSLMHRYWQKKTVSTSRKTKNTRDGWLVGESKTLNVCVWMICAFHDFLYFICVYLLYDQININRYFVDFVDVVFLAVYSQKGDFRLCWYQKVFGWLVG